jgi:hypothetical protein
VWLASILRPLTFRGFTLLRLNSQLFNTDLTLFSLFRFQHLTGKNHICLRTCLFAYRPPGARGRSPANLVGRGSRPYFPPCPLFLVLLPHAPDFSAHGVLAHKQKMGDMPPWGVLTRVDMSCP